MHVRCTPREGTFDIMLDDEGESTQLANLTDGAIITRHMADLFADAMNRLIDRIENAPKVTKRKRLQSRLAAEQEEEARAAQRLESIRAKRAETAAQLAETDAAGARAK